MSTSVQIFTGSILADLVAEVDAWFNTDKTIRVFDLTVNTLVTPTSGQPGWVVLIEYSTGSSATTNGYQLLAQAGRSGADLTQQFATWRASNATAFVNGPVIVPDNTPLASLPLVSFFCANDKVTANPAGGSSGPLFEGSPESASTTWTLAGWGGGKTRVNFDILIKNATGSAAGVGLYINGDTTAAKYRQQFLFATNGSVTVSGDQGDAPAAVSLAANATARLRGYIVRTADTVSMIVERQDLDSSSLQVIGIYSIEYQGALPADITSIDLESTVAASIATTSEAIVWESGR